MVGLRLTLFNLFRVLIDSRRKRNWDLEHRHLLITTNAMPGEFFRERESAAEAGFKTGNMSWQRPYSNQANKLHNFPI